MRVLRSRENEDVEDGMIGLVVQVTVRKRDVDAHYCQHTFPLSASLFDNDMSLKQQNKQERNRTLRGVMYCRTTAIVITSVLS